MKRPLEIKGDDLKSRQQARNMAHQGQLTTD